MATEENSASDRLAILLREERIPVLFGLRAQCHLPTIERMLVDGASWHEIGAAIGWDPATAERWYAMESRA